MKRVMILVALAVLTTSALPFSTSAATACTPTDYYRDGINMTAAIINPSAAVIGEVDGTGCNIGVYFDRGIGSVNGANVHGANYFGVLVNGDVNVVAVDVKNSRIHDIGEAPLNGSQHGVAIYYRGFGTGTASGKISGNKIWNYQKGGIVTNGAGTTANVSGNTVTGQGPVTWIAQNGIQVGYGAKATVMQNTVTGNSYSGKSGTASGGVIVVGGPGYGDAYTTGAIIDSNTVLGNDIGIWLSNIDESYYPPTSQTNVKVVNNVINNSGLNNVSGYGYPVGYQAGIADQGNNDKLINNKISGAGYDPANTSPTMYTYWIDASAPWTSKAKVHANKFD